MVWGVQGRWREVGSGLCQKLTFTQVRAAQREAPTWADILPQALSRYSFSRAPDIADSAGLAFFL